MSFSKSKIGQLCLKITEDIYKNQISLYFREPVNTPEYRNFIKNPMDLGTVKKKLTTNKYTSFDSWKHDMDLIYSNAVEYNTEVSEIAGMALYLKKKTDKMVKYLDLYNKQNFEEYVRAYYRELRDLSCKKFDLNVKDVGHVFPIYNFKEIDEKLSKVDDTTDIEQIISSNSEGEKSKIIKREVVLDNLKRSLLDEIWLSVNE